MPLARLQPPQPSANTQIYVTLCPTAPLLVLLQLLRGPSGERYARTLASLGLQTLEPLVIKLGLPPLGLLEPLLLEISGKPRAFVVNMDRGGLSRCGGSVEKRSASALCPPCLHPGVRGVAATVG